MMFPLLRVLNGQTTILTTLQLLLFYTSAVRSVRVRLVGSNLPGAGRVEVFYSGIWGTVCDDSWDNNDAKVVCRSLGYSDGRAFGSALLGRGTGRIWLDDVACGRSATDLEECGHAGWGSHNCNHGEDAGAWCVRDGDVILTNGNNVNTGRVEVYHNGGFGTICDDSFDHRDADVICKMLGFPSGGVAHGAAKFGQGSGQIWLDDLICGLNDTRLDQCNPNWGSHNCAHSEDAGVYCYQSVWTTTPCSVTCGSGTLQRSITCSGTGCKSRNEALPCLRMACPVDGRWSPWNDWTSCSVTCGRGTSTRSRQCNNPAPAHNGRTCPGDQNDLKACSPGHICPIDGHWGMWNSWTSCSVSCERGTRSRSRQCNNPAPAYLGRPCSGDEQESEECSPGIMCPIDGRWGQWNDWSSCSVSCEIGTRTRSRQCNNPAPAHNGRTCAGDERELDRCNSGIMCPIDGQWGAWNDWTSCSVSCEIGTRTRSRPCNNPAPAHNGRTCPGDQNDSESCSPGIMCPVDGQWGSWNGWSSCSASCGNGTRSRSRQCNNPAPAHSGRSCLRNAHALKGCTARKMCPIDGQWGSWNGWSSCSASCGNGTRSRSRQCNNPTPAHNGRTCSGDLNDSEACSHGIRCPIDGHWGLWNDWTSCSVSCEIGTRTRSRQCNNPTPAHNGRTCPGDQNDLEACSPGIMCPIDGQWGSWNGWSSCSASCENGTRSRSRQCNNPAPAHSGRSCPGNAHDLKGCTVRKMCPIDGQWESWNGWSSCSASCGNGTRSRSRQCNNPAPAHNGRTCSGDLNDLEACSLGIRCPIDGHWGLWNDWTSCSVSCEIGTRTRFRQCNNPTPAHNGRTCPGDQIDSEACNPGIMCPVDGQWSHWNDWTSCSVSCDNGTRARYRQCNNPTPKHNGRSCQGYQQESKGCTAGIKCPIDGQWGKWTQWSSCSVTCECGEKIRSRECDSPYPDHDGMTCTGNSSEITGCGVDILCPGGCGKDKLMCVDKRTCISVSMSCDGVRQCPDGGDEINCIGRNLLYLPKFEYLFSSDSTKTCPSLPWTLIIWLSIVFVQRNVLFVSWR